MTRIYTDNRIEPIQLHNLLRLASIMVSMQDVSKGLKSFSLERVQSIKLSFLGKRVCKNYILGCGKRNVFVIEF